MITPGLWPTNRYSQGIQCVGPSITFSPFVTSGHTYALPKVDVTRQNIYNEDTGAIKYVQETPRFEKENFSTNLGASLQFNIPLGRGIDLCHDAVRINIENQQLLNKKTRLEISLHLLEHCAKQAKLGVTFKKGSKYAVVCEDVVVTVPPNQTLPHRHSLSSSQ